MQHLSLLTDGHVSGVDDFFIALDVNFDLSIIFLDAAIFQNLDALASGDDRYPADQPTAPRPCGLTLKMFFMTPRIYTLCLRRSFV